MARRIDNTRINATDEVWQADNIREFEEKLETLREQYHIPSLSVGIVNGKEMRWHKGLGYSDIAAKKVPDQHTVYHLASITKTFGAILLLRLVEEGKISLDDPIAKYGINLGARWGSDERIKIKHLLTHTAMGNTYNAFKPGYTFRYHGDWYNRLGQAIEKASGESFGTLFMQDIVQPLQLKNTVPSTADSTNFALTGYDLAAFSKKVAVPYNWEDNRHQLVHLPYGFGPGAGIMSSVADLAVYSNAIDERMFLKKETWDLMFTPFVTAKGKTIPYGLGWFVKNYGAVKIIWHTGWWLGYSSLLVKIPEKDLTFIILANSQDLSRPFYHRLWPIPFSNPFRRNLNNNLLASDFAKLFLKHFAL